MFQRGRRKGQEWLADVPAYGTFWQDIPGEGRRRIYINLGIYCTRSAAQRKRFEHIEQLGLNSHRRLAELASNVTFGEREIWLKSLANRNPIEQTTIDTRRYALDKWIYPPLGHKYLADINNPNLTDLVEKMANELSAASIRDYTQIVKWVVESAVNMNGEPKFPGTWNDEYIDAPLIGKQRQPTSSCAGVTDIIVFATGQYRMLRSSPGAGPCAPARH